MTREEKAVYYKHNGFNCCQSVIKAMIDLSDSDKEILTNAASGFAVGMGCMEATCGALIGATMMAGIVKPGKKSAITAREILNKFQEYSGATICKDLKGKDTGVVLCECDDCIRNAIRLLTRCCLWNQKRKDRLSKEVKDITVVR
ncbi:C_GCAxxG_C_C family protein [Coprococcus catus]|uniref:C_GCAxxG_C_C family protein n=1 Tax=Coprococcus catus TaxID=116085 RepID=A0A3E2TTM7_9FIRM|nr:C_GCAxxG_C_C family protein [Coprococcus catus]